MYLYTQMVYYSIRYTTTIDKSTGLPYPYRGSPVPESMLPFMDVSDDMFRIFRRSEHWVRITLGDQIFEDQTSTDIGKFIDGIPSYDEIEEEIIKTLFNPKYAYKVMDYLIKIEDGSEAISLDPIELVTPVTPVKSVKPIESDESYSRILADIDIDKTTLNYIMKELHCNNLDETKEMLKKYKLDCSKFTWSRKDHEAFLSALNYFNESENFYTIEYDCRP
jgi:hypothetical protein